MTTALYSGARHTQPSSPWGVATSCRHSHGEAATPNRRPRGDATTSCRHSHGESDSPNRHRRGEWPHPAVIAMGSQPHPAVIAVGSGHILPSSPWGVATSCRHRRGEWPHPAVIAVGSGHILPSSPWGVATSCRMPAEAGIRGMEGHSSHQPQLLNGDAAAFALPLVRRTATIYFVGVWRSR